MKFKNIPILMHLKKLPFCLTAMGFGILFFDFNYLLMKNLPGVNAETFQCTFGGSFTGSNVFFSILFSVLMGLLIAGFLALLMAQRNMKSKTIVFSSSGLGTFLGMFTVFCPFCAFGFITLFGASFNFLFFVKYNLFFKLMSLFFLMLALFLLNQQMQKKCDLCAFFSREKKG